MDVKGIAWVGRLYQKFETMCLEVEDIICQDTVKYVENQVEVVGASVKKFYSEVVQDLLPPSALNDEKVAVNSAPDRHENVVICKKPVMSMKIERPKFDEEKSTKNSKVTSDTKREIIHKLPHGHHHADNPHLVSSPYSANRVHIDGYSRKKDDEDIHDKLGLDGRESTSEGCKCLTETSSTNLVWKYANDASSCCAISNSECENSSELAGDIAGPLLVKDTRCDSVMQISNETEIQSNNLSAGISSKSTGDNEKETRLLSYGDSSAELDGRSDAWSIDEIEHDATILEHGIENIQHADEAKLDEACVLVNEDDFHFDSNEEARCRPYKKITGAFSFTKKSKRKQEYKELAVKHSFGISPIPNQKHEQKLPTEEVSEHDWQLLQAWSL
ncbi:uncharacterized protein LOC111018050 isoform X2 [Momordica charantia]|uniref:Uncharacterized protein LOC111018050 isoform X2 n=1 Tax=Momordica charantia TaxID=3673 RepID=A0A6J1D7F5_MOMCH|nr:uncharacterized protein LOC111018050 isoform X2 [Momordica charantia]